MVNMPWLRPFAEEARGHRKNFCWKIQRETKNLDVSVVLRAKCSDHNAP